MSNASHIDLFVDLKEIQSQMPRVAFFPLLEIKRFNLPASPHSSLSFLLLSVCSTARPLPSSPAPPPTAPDRRLFSFLHLLLPNKVFILPYKLALCHSRLIQGEQSAALQIIISARQGCYWAEWSRRMESDLVGCGRTGNQLQKDIRGM